MSEIKVPDSWKDKLEKVKPCWIVWEFNRVTRKTDLRAICTTEENAKVEKMLVDHGNESWDRKSERIVSIERSRLNHLFGASMYREYFNK